ncbi:MAG TPA: hypothetical protein VFG23_00560 [Polyangia bacterium]|nr:hypothetical protein [Polyangia bacterium]
MAAWVAGCTTTVEVLPAAQALAPRIATVVGLPISIGWGGATELQRLQRRTSDSLIAASGGRAVIAEELVTGEDDAQVAAACEALGVDPTSALTFAISVTYGGRQIEGVSAIPGFIVGKNLLVDFHAHLEVRHVGSGEVIGTVETVDTGAPNEPEIAPNGDKHAVMRAIDSAIEKAITTFAPRLVSPPHGSFIVEVPVAAADSPLRRVTTLAELYPELSIEQTQALGQSRERFLVVTPGELAPLGILAGDLLGVPGGQTKASRAALARAVARGQKPALAIVRGGQRYILASR